MDSEARAESIGMTGGFLGAEISFTESGISGLRGMSLALQTLASLLILGALSVRLFVWSEFPRLLPSD